MTDGTAIVVTDTSIEMVTDGPCLAGTLEELGVGAGAKPMPPHALAKVRADALELTAKVLDCYATYVAKGEVGRGGSGIATNTPPLSGNNPTGLLYGRIQSGKTVAMISFCAAAIDNGFRIIVVLTSDFVKLVEQTAERFAALDGPLVRNALQSEKWHDDREHVAKQIAKHGIVFICTKNPQRLTALVEFLNEIGAADHPALVLDDEADQATLDTTVAARSSGRKNAPQQSSTIHRNIVQDDEGQSIRQTLRHHVFLQVTATPYALLLQNVDSALRPSFTQLLEPGEGYTGGEAFFDVPHVESGEPPLVFIEEDETTQIDSSASQTPPVGLQKAIAFFLVAAAAQSLVDPTSRSSGQNFLCHTSQRTADHARVAQRIRTYLNRITDDLETERTDSDVLTRLHGGYAELQRTLPQLPAFDEIIGRIRKRLPRREVPIVNSANSPVDFGRQLNFIVGGNILGRGLTIDNLLVTYYLRRAKVSQMDTVLQHARMFGYRRALMPYTRVFLPDSLGARFHFIHVAEKNLRRQLAENPGRGSILVETMSSLRATRLSVLDTRNLAAYEAGEQIYPGAASLDRKDLERSSAIEGAIRDVTGGVLREGEFTPIAFPSMTGLLQMLPFDSELANMWDPDMLSRALERMAPRYDSAFLYFRSMQRSKLVLATGALSGDELATARAKGAPVLCVFRDDGRKLKDHSVSHPYWFPTIVFPSDMATQLFNITN